MKLFALVLSTAALAGSCNAQTIDRVPVEDFKVLMVAAIDSTSGDAHGILIGDMARAIAEKMQTTAPILVDVRTLRRYKQPGCSRLNVTFSQEGVVLPGAPAPRKQTMDIGINYCRDGSPPRSLT
jgi:hypothetical protein